jgi:cytoskeletal protein RodZ
MTQLADFGRYLQQQRELRGLSVDDVVKATRIPPTLIGALETGHGERFPERVFVVNYIRSYARVVGLSPDDALNRYHELPGAEPPPAFDPTQLEAERQHRAWTVLWGGAVALLGSVLVVGVGGALELASHFAGR